MKLVGIYLYPDLVEYRSDAARSFRNQTRYICNYLQRYLAAQNLKVDGFNKICVVCKDVPLEPTYVNSSKALISEVQFNMPQYEMTAEEELPEYFITLLESGISKCCRDQRVSYECFEQAIHSFRNENYLNEWVFLEKNFRAERIKCRLRCKLDLLYFRLTLEIEYSGQLVLSQEILRTLPDEVVYSHRFKDIHLDKQSVIVRDKFGAPLATIPLKGL